MISSSLSLSLSDRNRAASLSNAPSKVTLTTSAALLLSFSRFPSCNFADCANVGLPAQKATRRANVPARHVLFCVSYEPPPIDLHPLAWKTSRLTGA